MRLLGASALVMTVGVTLANAQATTPGQMPQTQQQQPTTPSRTPTRPLRPGEQPPKGTAVIKGYVTAGGTGAPIRRAQVRAMSMEGRGGGVTQTDGEGRFEIKELPASRYLVSASKGGFVTGQFGQRRPTDPGTPIDLADGQTAEKVSFILARGGVISGRIVDDGGEPVSGTQVGAMRYQFMAGSRRLMNAQAEGGTDRTDDQGGFRLYGLPPGDYYISASNRQNMMMMPSMNNTETEAFAPTYYPGTPNVTEATRVTVKAGQEAQASFALIVARMARIRGHAMNSSGQPAANTMLMLTPGDGAMTMIMMGMSNSMVAPDGTFQFANVPPGKYNLQMRPNGMATATSEMATIPITVGNDDIDNLVVVSAPGAIARGVVMTDDSSTPPFRPDQINIFAQPVDAGTVMVNPGPSRIGDDYSFEITGLSDRRMIRASAGSAPNSGWYLKSVLFDGTDITETGMEFTAGRTYEGLQIIFTRKTTDLSGTLTDDRGRPVVDATVVIFPADPQKWTYGSRYMRSVRPDTNGKFNAKSLPPSEDYLMIAVQNLESGQGADPEFLARAKEEAKSFSLTEGETKAVDIKLSKLVP